MKFLLTYMQGPIFTKTKKKMENAFFFSKIQKKLKLKEVCPVGSEIIATRTTDDGQIPYCDLC